MADDEDRELNPEAVDDVLDHVWKDEDEEEEKLTGEGEVWGTL